MNRVTFALSGGSQKDQRFKRLFHFFDGGKFITAVIVISACGKVGAGKPS